MLQIPVQVGALRHRVEIVNLQSGPQDVFGASSAPVKVPFATVWGRVQALQGKDLYQAEQFVSQVSHQVTIRYMRGIKGGDYVVYDRRAFRIQAVINPEERNIILNLLCLENNDGSEPQIVLAQS